MISSKLNRCVVEMNYVRPQIMIAEVKITYLERLLCLMNAA
jgi:hypothetical protein